MRCDRMEGTLYIITGISNGEKFAELLYKYLSSKEENLLLLNQEVLKKVFNIRNNLIDERKSLFMKTCKLGNVLVKQNIGVICYNDTMFDECREWIERNVKNYMEIHIKISTNQLIERIYNNKINVILKNIEEFDFNTIFKDKVRILEI